MREPRFWRDRSWRARALSAGLEPLALLMRLGGALRHATKRSRRAPIPVICVGNLTLGGSGKTPTAIYLARRMGDMGETPHIISRGYGRRRGEMMRVQPSKHNSDDVGDEPLLLAAAAPAWVGRDRPRMARQAANDGASLIIMDDGFQNPSLHKDISLLVADGDESIGNGRIFPAGPLREPISRGMRRASLLLVIGEGDKGEGAEGLIREAQARHIPIMLGALRPDPREAEALKDRRLLAFAGVGRPQKFMKTLRHLGAEIVAERVFPNHHSYREREAAALLSEAEREGVALITTEKDMARLRFAPASSARAALWRRARALPVSLHLGERDEALLLQILGEVIHRARKDFQGAGMGPA